MESIHVVLEEADEYTKKGEKQKALERYSDAFNLLVVQATAFARNKTGGFTDEEQLREITPLLLEYSKQYLTQNSTAARILNTMGLLFDELGEYHNAKQKFEDAIDYTPSDIVYDEPRRNLEYISSRIIRTKDLESVDEQ